MLTRSSAQWIVTAAMVAGAVDALDACPVCFRIEDGPMVGAIQTAVLVLVGVTLAVLGGFAVFIARFIRRSRRVDAGLPPAP